MVKNMVRGALCLSPMIGLMLVNTAMAQSSKDSDGRFALAYANQDKTTHTETTTTTTTTTTMESGRMDPGGPIDMRSENPTTPGELEWKNTFGWSTTRAGEDDDWSYELELEYGLVENHGLLFSLPVEIGDGEVRGNADITLGWHWRFVQEEGDMPGLGMRNFIRVPSGVHSNGVDYRWVGLISKTLTDKARLHFNPFLEVIGYDEDDDDGGWWGNDDANFNWGSWNWWSGSGDDAERGDFVWGAVVGADYDVCPNVLFVWDYIYRSGDYEGVHDQHSMQVGFDWDFAENQKLGFTTNIGLDGDSVGEALGAELMYVIAFGG